MLPLEYVDRCGALCREAGRGLHSSTFRLNLSRFSHKIHPIHPLISPDTPYTPPRQPRNFPPIPQKSRLS